MKKSVIIIAVIALISVLAYSQRATLAEKIMAKGLESRLKTDTLGELPRRFAFNPLWRGWPYAGTQSFWPLCGGNRWGSIFR
ncbi:MAG: hypothetical protein ACI9WC_001116 [Arenicella sp.]|jgi:hypothetical protein